jgi:peptide/nickel transport system substrate-binding protein
VTGVRCTLFVVLASVVSLAGCGRSGASAAASRDTVLRVVPAFDLEVLDPSWVTTYVTRDHGFMVYDTLFGLDAERRIRPQMVDTWHPSADGKTWTFTLRAGLEFHDGTPVTSDDVIASIRRWANRDTLGQRLMALSTWEVVDEKTFRVHLSAPYGLLLDSLAKPDSYVPFIYPKRLADTPPSMPITEPTGSGPFIFLKEEWKPGEKVVYVRNSKYRPRPEPASGTAGGKVVKVDRVEWISIKDPQAQVSALLTGDVDLLVEPPYTSYASLRRDPGVQMFLANTVGYFFFLRFNHLQPPFNNPKVRLAAVAAMNQVDFLKTQVGLPDMYRTCFSFYHCESQYATTAGMDALVHPDMARARERLRASGYDGTPVVVMQSTDLATISKLPVIAAQLLREAGFNVDLQAVDNNTMTARRNQPRGWNVFLTYGTAWSSAAPVSMNLLSAAGSTAYSGWPSDAEIERLRDAFAAAASDESRQMLATQIQVRAMEIGLYVPLGNIWTMLAARRNVTGFIKAPMAAFWNVEKQ